MKRSDFLKVTGLGLISLWLDPLRLLEALAAPAASLPGFDSLVLIELQGGNDGLNTVIPYANGSYYRLRPQIGIPRAQVLQLSPELGMHPALAPLLPIWQQKQLAWVLGVGYPAPNRSHFRSIEIWESGSQANQYLSSGWLASVLGQLPAARRSLADGILLGQEDAGPLAGESLRTVALNGMGQLPQVRSSGLKSNGPAALQHIFRIEQEIGQAGTQLQQRLKQAPPLNVAFPTTPLGRQLEQTASLIRAGIPAPVYKLTHGGFDTHRQQQPQQAMGLNQLAQGLKAFHQALLPGGHWNRTLVMTYSEFGRRVAENGSHGTDHGTASPQLVLGGRVKGGFYGRQPSLEALNEGDLNFSVDFHSLYQTVARRWWGVQSPWSEQVYPSLTFV